MTRPANALALLLLCIASYLVAPALPALDDAYITLHSAHVVASGAPDPAWPVPALVGITSPPALALLVGLIKSGIPDLVALRLFIALCLVAYVFGIWWLSGALGFALPVRVGWLVVALLSGPVFFQLTNGVETGWAMALMIMAIAASIDQRFLIVAGLAGLLPCVRPDLGPIAVALWIYSAWRVPTRQAWAMVAISSAVAFPWFLWLHHDLGTWLPATLTAKRWFFATGCLPALAKAAIAAHAVYLWALTIGPLFLGLLVLPRTRLGQMGAGALGLTLLIYGVTIPSALLHNNHRYLYAFAWPWMLYGAMTWAARPKRARVALVLLMLPVLWTASTFRTASRDNLAMAEEVRASSLWLAEQTPASARILVHDAGGSSAYAQRPLIDLVGLKTPSSIAIHHEWTWQSCGADRRRAFVEIARASQADYVMLVSDWDDEYFHISDALRNAGFISEPALRLPATGQRGYRVFPLHVTPSQSR